MGKREQKVSLRTRDPAEAKIAHARVSAEIEERWHRLTAGAQDLSHRQAEAVAGEIYRAMVAEHADNPDRASVSSLWIDRVFVEGESRGKIVPVGVGTARERSLAFIEKHRTSRNAKHIDAWLAMRGWILSPESRSLVDKAVDKAILQVREQLYRMGKGDYRPDPDADRFPKLETQPKLSKDKFSVLRVFDDYAAEAKLAPTTIKKWRPILMQVAAEVPDIRNLTREWCITWKDRHVARGIVPKSVKETYIASIRSTCEWAVSNGRMSENPALRIKIKVPKGTSKRGYTDAEAAKILRASLEPMSSRRGAEQRVARRWIPSLCAYTGARVGEMAQLRKQDIRKVDGVWMLRITPEAGSVKTNEQREIAIHPELIRQGFIDFVSQSTGPLFCAKKSPRQGSDQNPTYKKVGERIAKWIRKEVGITDKNVSPNHAWRHRFVTVADDVDMKESTMDYILGHAPATVGRRYGERKPKPQYREISKIPVIGINPKSRGRRGQQAEAAATDNAPRRRVRPLGGPERKIIGRGGSAADFLES
nr:tyrosine-type recombinase/integrase [Afipia sp. Root123D2]